MLDHQLAAAQAQLQAATLAQIVLTQVEPRPQPLPRSATVDRAAELLRTIWAEPALQLDYDAVQGTFHLTRGDDPGQLVENLPDPEQHQVMGCLQLALLTALAPQPVPLPLVLQRPTLGTADVARRAAGLLCEVAAQGQQILLVTTDPAVTVIFQDLGMPTLVVSRLGPESSADPAASLPHEGATA